MVDKKLFILNIPPEKADDLIEDKILKGEALLKLKIKNIQQWKTAEKKFKVWNSENYELLKLIFKNNKVAKDYSSSGWSIGRIFVSDLKLSEKTAKLNIDIQDKLDKLNSIKLSLGIFKIQDRTGKRDNSKRLFFVHGTNCSTKTMVINFITELGLEPIVLQEFIAGGKTLIEEILTRSEVKFAIVLLTPDNVGGIQPDNLKFRADQNVILELGIFVGLFGREKVCGLYTNDLQIPEDYHGFEYIKIDKSGKWREQVFEELKTAGFEI